jgi:hypothetical protein
MKVNNKKITVEPYLKTIERKYTYLSIEDSEAVFLNVIMQVRRNCQVLSE